MIARLKTLPTLVMFEFSSESNNEQPRKLLFDAILCGKCPDFEYSLGGEWDAYQALWRAEHAPAVQAWAESNGLRFHCAGNATRREESLPRIKLPDIGDIAPGGVVGPCLADAERMLADQGLAPTARNWLAVCDHFLSLPLLSPGRAAAFRLLRRGIEHDALGAVEIDSRPSPPAMS